MDQLESIDLLSDQFRAFAARHDTAIGHGGCPEFCVNGVFS